MENLRHVRRHLAISLLVAIGSSVAVWNVLYPLAGYSHATLMAAQLTTAVIGAAGIMLCRLSWRDVGIGLSSLLHAVIAGGIVMAGFLLLVWTLGPLLSTQIPLIRPAMTFWPFLDNWVLTALGEELLFCGLLYHLARRSLPDGKRWLAVPLVALMFAAWHLPGYLARDLSIGATAGRLALNGVSWLFFGTAYALSRNLWMATIMHANTNYSISPLITQSPPLGLLFMAMMLTAAWRLGHTGKGAGSEATPSGEVPSRMTEPKG